MAKNKFTKGIKKSAEQGALSPVVLPFKYAWENTKTFFRPVKECWQEESLRPMSYRGREDFKMFTGIFTAIGTVGTTMISPIVAAETGAALSVGYVASMTATAAVVTPVGLAGLVLGGMVLGGAGKGLKEGIGNITVKGIRGIKSSNKTRIEKRAKKAEAQTKIVSDLSPALLKKTTPQPPRLQSRFGAAPPQSTTESRFRAPKKLPSTKASFK